MTSQQIELSSGTLHVEIQGSGSPILFVHGFPLDGRMWDAQVERFSQDFQTIVPDLRGFGKSGSVAPGEVLGMDRYADDLNELLDRLGVTEKICFCGLSMGGYVTWQFWKKYRDRLNSLVLCDTRAVADSDEAKENREKTAKMVEERGNDPLAEAMSPKLFAPQTPSDVLSQVGEMIREASVGGVAAASRGMATRPDVSDWLGEIDLPCLLVVGEHDAISSPAEMKEIAESISGSRFVEIPDAGHMSPMENPKAFNAALADFLS